MTTGTSQLVAGKHLLVTGVATTDSIAFATADALLRGGADVVLGVFPRDLERAAEAASTLAIPAPVVELDLPMSCTSRTYALGSRPTGGSLTAHCMPQRSLRKAHLVDASPMLR